MCRVIQESQIVGERATGGKGARRTPEARGTTRLLSLGQPSINIQPTIQPPPLLHRRPPLALL